MILRKNPLLKFLGAVLQDALVLSISNFIASRLEEQYEKFFGIDSSEEKKEKSDGK